MHPSTPTILVVEDDLAVRTFLTENLVFDGYAVHTADSVREGLRLLAAHPPDLAVVDVGLPDATGYELLQQVRDADGITSRIDPLTPVVLLSGRADDMSRVRGFEQGADDFVAKPFLYAELRGRIAAVLRRARGRRALGRIHVGPLEIDPSTHEVRLHGARLPLPGKEFALLRTLAADPVRVFTKHELLRLIWGYQSGAQTRTLDTHACRLRQRLRAYDDSLLVTVWGVGYRLVEAPVDAPAATPVAA